MKPPEPLLTISIRGFENHLRDCITESLSTSLIEQYIKESVEKINIEQLVKDEIDRRVQGRTLSLVEEIVEEAIENAIQEKVNVMDNTGHPKDCQCVGCHERYINAMGNR